MTELMLTSFFGGYCRGWMGKWLVKIINRRGITWPAGKKGIVQFFLNNSWVIRSRDRRGWDRPTNDRKAHLPSVAVNYSRKKQLHPNVARWSPIETVSLPEVRSLGNRADNDWFASWLWRPYISFSIFTVDLGLATYSPLLTIGNVESPL